MPKKNIHILVEEEDYNKLDDLVTHRGEKSYLLREMFKKLVKELGDKRNVQESGVSRT